jgi:hypothetical protein
MTVAVQKQEEGSEVIALLEFAKRGPFTEKALSEFYCSLRRKSYSKIELIVIDHIAAFCRAPIRGKERKPFTREEIERDFPYMDGVRRAIPHPERLDLVSDDVFRSLALIGAIMDECGHQMTGEESVECILACRKLIFPLPKAV